MASTQTKLAAATTVVREEDLQEMEELEREIRDRAEKARSDGRAFMLAQYTRILGMVKPEVKRIRNRFDREDLAMFRNAHKQLKKSQEADQEQETDQEQEAEEREA